MPLLFVYGTLREGAGNESLLGDCEWVADARVKGTLHDLRRYPALILGGDQDVHGELYRCPDETLLDLDAYEGVGKGLFVRERVDSSGGPCWTYVAGPRLRRRISGSNVIPSGRWVPSPPPEFRS